MVDIKAPTLTFVGPRTADAVSTAEQESEVIIQDLDDTSSTTKNRTADISRFFEKAKDAQGRETNSTKAHRKCKLCGYVHPPFVPVSVV